MNCWRHRLVVGEVRAMEERDGDPLLYHRSRYTHLAAAGGYTL